MQLDCNYEVSFIGGSCGVIRPSPDGATGETATRATVSRLYS